MLPALYHSQDQVEPNAIVKDHVWPDLNRNSIRDTLSQNLDHFALSADCGCAFHCTLMCVIIFHSTAELDLCCKSLTGTIPSEIGTMAALSESCVVWLLVLMIGVVIFIIL
jgi:hypothetical protein